MEFLKKHYEKILLSLVLIGLAVAVATLPAQIRQVKEKIAATQGDIEAKPKKYKPINLAPYDAAFERLKSNPPIVLSGAHNTFNPVQWQRGLDGSLIKIVSPDVIGLQQLRVTAINPLYFTLALDKLSGKSYSMAVTREAAPDPKLRKKVSRYVSMTSTNVSGLFALLEVKGPLTAPEELTFELADTKEKAVVTKDKPFKRVDGYLFDAVYPLENRTFTGVHKDEEIAFGGDEYKVVDITPDSVVFFVKASQKRVTKKLEAAAPSAKLEAAPSTNMVINTNTAGNVK